MKKILEGWKRAKGEEYGMSRPNRSLIMASIDRGTNIGSCKAPHVDMSVLHSPALVEESETDNFEWIFSWCGYFYKLWSDLNDQSIAQHPTGRTEALPKLSGLDLCRKGR